MAANGIGSICGAGQRIQDTFVQMVGVGPVGLRVNHALGDGDRRRAAFGTKLIESGRFGTNTAVVGNVGTAHGSGEHTVTECGSAQGDGLTEVRIFSFHSYFLH